MLTLLEGRSLVDLCCAEDLVPLSERFGSNPESLTG